MTGPETHGARVTAALKAAQAGTLICPMNGKPCEQGCIFPPESSAKWHCVTWVKAQREGA